VSSVPAPFDDAGSGALPQPASAAADGPVLGIETSGTLTGAALWAGGRLAGETAVDAKSQSQELLPDLIARLLRTRGLAPRDLARIGVSLGPGSFTGLRVGLAAARGLAAGAELPLVGVPSHEALAWPWSDAGAELCLLTGLRRGEVFLEIGRWDGPEWRASVPGSSLPAEEAAARLVALPTGPARLLLGEAAPLLERLHPEIAGAGRIVRETLAATRRPAVVACLAARPGVRLYAGADLDRLQPLYLRGADARRPARAPRSAP